MPKDPGGGHKPELPQHVKDYFTRRGQSYEDLPARTLETLATLSPDEVNVLERVGASLQADGADERLYACVIH